MRTERREFGFLMKNMQAEREMLPSENLMCSIICGISSNPKHVEIPNRIKIIGIETAINNKYFLFLVFIFLLPPDFKF